MLFLRPDYYVLQDSLVKTAIFIVPLAYSIFISDPIYTKYSVQLSIIFYSFLFLAITTIQYYKVKKTEKY